MHFLAIIFVVNLLRVIILNLDYSHLSLFFYNLFHFKEMYVLKSLKKNLKFDYKYIIFK